MTLGRSFTACPGLTNWPPAPSNIHNVRFRSDFLSKKWNWSAGRHWLLFPFLCKLSPESEQSLSVLPYTRAEGLPFHVYNSSRRRSKWVKIGLSGQKTPSFA